MKKNILFIILFAISTTINAQWVQQTSGSVDNFWSAFFPTATTGYITDYTTGYLLKTTNGGANWNSIGTSGPMIGSMYFTSVDTGYATGTGEIYKTIDGGATWSN